MYIQCLTVNCTQIDPLYNYGTVYVVQDVPVNEGTLSTVIPKARVFYSIQENFDLCYCKLSRYVTAKFEHNPFFLLLRYTGPSTRNETCAGYLGIALNNQ